MSSAAKVLINHFKCESCGGDCTYNPEAGQLKCNNCESLAAFDAVEARIEEMPYHDGVALSELDEAADEVFAADCQGCGASVQVEDGKTASRCPYCDSAVVVEGASHKQLRPQALLPFCVSREKARGLFKQWLSALWFAPNDLKNRGAIDGRLTGLYTPYWTFDSHTHVAYRGQRGEYYWVTESYTVTVNGKTQHRTRQVRKTRWYPAQGNIRNFFNDILVVASRSLPLTMVRKLDPWDLPQLVPVQEEYLAGFSAECYQVPIDDAFVRAEELMVPTVELLIKQDIGGDCQRISDYQMAHHEVKYKHILLPVWVAAFKYKTEVYRFVINGRTGEVQGERPYSWVKITLAVMGVIALALGVLFLWQQSQG